jgi:hypothetical protein
MGILSRLFGSRSTTERSDADTRKGEATDSDLFQNFLDLPSHGFFGSCSHSPNKHFTLGWRDANDSGSRGGSRSSGLGRYILLRGEEVLVEGRMARPNDGRVANNGVFVLNDWEFTKNLSGVFSAFCPDGKKILSRRFKANLYNNGLSADGRIAVCQTCNSPDQYDSSVLAVFDLATGQEIATWVAESGWASSYEFPPGHQTVELGYPDGSTYTYSLHGEFVDRVKWANAELLKGNLLVVERLLKAAEKECSPELAQKLIGSIDIALAAARPGDGRTQAWGYKLRGMCLETQHDPVQALACYEKALAFDPRVGVKRRADQLRKAITS